MAKYIRVCKGLEDKGMLMLPESLQTHIGKDWDSDYYYSIYKYNDEQLNKFRENGTVSGITDVTTDQLVFDFDYKDDLNFARIETLEAIYRLEKFKIEKESIQIFFSGNKGFSLVVFLNKDITPDQAANIAIHKIGTGLQTLDKKIYNAS